MHESDTDILRVLFNESVHISVENNTVMLSEPNQPDCTVSIRNLPDDAICVKADVIDMRNLFGDTPKGECKRADFIIFSESRKNILMIEIKKNKTGWKHVCQQLHGASCLAKYCLEVGRTFWQARHSRQDYTYSYVSISQVVLKGRKVFAHETSALDNTVQVKKITHPHHLQYAQLV